MATGSEAEVVRPTVSAAAVGAAASTWGGALGVVAGETILIAAAAVQDLVNTAMALDRTVGIRTIENRILRGAWHSLHERILTSKTFKDIICIITLYHVVAMFSLDTALTETRTTVIRCHRPETTTCRHTRCHPIASRLHSEARLTATGSAIRTRVRRPIITRAGNRRHRE